MKHDGMAFIPKMDDGYNFDGPIFSKNCCETFWSTVGHFFYNIVWLLYVYLRFLVRVMNNMFKFETESDLPKALTPEPESLSYEQSNSNNVIRRLHNNTIRSLPPLTDVPYRNNENRVGITLDLHGMNPTAAVKLVKQYTLLLMSSRE